MIVVGIDARDGLIALRGWEKLSNIHAIEFAQKVAEMGVERLVYTDIARDGMLYAVSPYVELLPEEEPFEESVRYRTVGDMSCTGAVRSTAATLDEVVAEIAATRCSGSFILASLALAGRDGSM